jgi:hypothetical protein
MIDQLGRECALVAAEWPTLSPIQRMHRLALLELRSGEEWEVLGTIFASRAAVLTFREAA